MNKKSANQDSMVLQEAKVIFVGQGSVGKTSLIKKLVSGEDLNIFEPPSNGIVIRDWNLKSGNIIIRTHVWDFGGQEIMHTTHQFFLTERALYVLVLDSRIEEDENRLEYWLKIIQAFGGKDASIILVGNKLDYQDLHINKTGLRKKYEGVIKDIIETSCLDGRGIDELRSAIVRELSNLTVVRQRIDPKWFAVKDEIKLLGHDFVSYEVYTDLCSSKGIDNENHQRQLSELLHDLGIVLNFYRDPTLKNTYILNPSWVTEGVYGIINSNQLFQKKGVIEFDKLAENLNPGRYPSDKILFIIELMRKFELCYEFDEAGTKKYFIPALLEYEEKYTGDWGSALEFEYHYKILPSSVISRFIVRMHPYIMKNTVWRNGVLLSWEDCLSLVKADYDRKYIKILVQGTRRKNLLTIIRGQLDSIHRSFNSLEVQEMVPIPNYPSANPVEYKFLRELQRNKRKTFPTQAGNEIIDVNVKSLLNNIEGDTIPTNHDDKWDKSSITQLVIAGFYLFAFLLVFSVIAFASTKVSWQILLIAPGVGLVLIIVTASVGLLSIRKLNQDNFTSIITEALKQLPLIGSFFKRKQN